MNEDMQNNYLSNEERELGTLLENSLIDMQKMDTSELEKILIFEVSNEVLDVNDCIIKYDRKNKWFMSVALNAHHGLMDGFHAAKFFDVFQNKLMNC